MIGYLKGQVIRKDTDCVVVNVGGVGYKVKISQNSIQKLKIGEVLELNIYTHVKEDSISLIGFKTQDELQIFEKLLDVPGVGPKTALTILSNTAHTNVVSAIRKADLKTFTDINGIGKKVAQKIIVELQPKFGKITEINLERKDVDAELISALKGLGFSKDESLRMSDGIDYKLPLKERIKTSLKTKDEE